ncbi:hypothetical protein [Epilithonimonas sp.]|uniref:hypothetical protein n=1 Tax=Epilithonimonas sp. TaxID=2894511 RepID=UPI0028A085F6|nr:hypothetical protein [Epilithonimonas sp.]
MIPQIIRKNISIISEKFNHEIFYSESLLLIKNNLNFIEIFPFSKEKILVKYNIQNGSYEVEIFTEYIYDLLINIFHRNELNKVDLNEGDLLSIKDLEEEFIDIKKIEIKLFDLMSKNAQYYNFGGNRVLTQYYKNTLILIDDICYAKSNVININNDKI